MGKLVDFKMQLFICEDTMTVVRIIGFPDDGGITAQGFKVPVDTIFRDI